MEWIGEMMGRRQCYIYPGVRGFVACDDYRWTKNDARGIPLTEVCANCRDAKLSKYRPEVLTDPQYAHDEPIYDGQSPHTFQIDEDA